LRPCWASGQAERKGNLTLLDKRLRHFARKSTTDFFVHKRLREFLIDELEFYIRDQVFTSWMRKPNCPHWRESDWP